MDHVVGSPPPSTPLHPLIIVKVLILVLLTLNDHVVHDNTRYHYVAVEGSLIAAVEVRR